MSCSLPTSHVRSIPFASSVSFRQANKSSPSFSAPQNSPRLDLSQRSSPEADGNIHAESVAWRSARREQGREIERRKERSLPRTKRTYAGSVKVEISEADSMVSSTSTENGATSPGEKPNTAVGIPPGDYRLVGWDMDATGKKLIDEICQIAGYTPSSAYSQYVMPYKDLNPPAIKRHNMKVVTIGKFRVLKDSKTNKVLKTKSEISALTEFLSWLESVKGEAVDGVILVYHEPRKVIPAMLLESLKKYDLLGRFKQTVKGFANGFNIAEAKCADNGEGFDNAKDRACLALQIVQYLSLSDNNNKTEEGSGSGDSDAAMKRMVEFIREFVQPVHVEEEEHAALKVIFQRQNSLRPIFDALFRINRRERHHASPLWRLLAEAGVEYTQLQEAWISAKKEGLEKLIKEKLAAAGDKQQGDLMNILESHFDTEKKPKYKSHERKEIKTEAKVIDDKENNNKCESETESPDTTTSGSPFKVKPDPDDKQVSAEA